MGRALRLRCPRCGEGMLFVNWYHMRLALRLVRPGLRTRAWVFSRFDLHQLRPDGTADDLRLRGAGGDQLGIGGRDSVGPGRVLRPISHLVLSLCAACGWPSISFGTRARRRRQVADPIRMESALAGRAERSASRRTVATRGGIENSAHGRSQRPAGCLGGASPADRAVHGRAETREDQWRHGEHEQDAPKEAGAQIAAAFAGVQRVFATGAGPGGRGQGQHQKGGGQGHKRPAGRR